MMNLSITEILGSPAILDISSRCNPKSFIIKENKSSRVVSCIISDSLKAVRELKLSSRYSYLFPSCNYTIDLLEREFFCSVKSTVLRGIETRSTSSYTILNKRYRCNNSRLYMLESYSVIGNNYDFTFVYARNKNELQDFLKIFLKAESIPAKLILNKVQPYTSAINRGIEPNSLFSHMNYFNVSVLNSCERSYIDRE